MASPNSFRDPYWSNLASKAEQKYDITPGLLVSVLTNGERSNANQKSEVGASTVFQITPPTRDLILKRDGIDAYLNDENAAEAAALVLKDGVNWAKGRAKDPIDADRLASGYYHAGGDTANWGPKTNAYINRVMVGQQGAKASELDSGFAKFMAANPAVPAGRSADAGTPTAAPVDKKTDALSEGFGRFLQREYGSKVSIPGAEASDARPPAADPTIGERIVGAGETALNLGTGFAAGAVAPVVGLADAFTNPTAGSLQTASDKAGQVAQDLTYAPRTAAGQSMAAATGDALSNAIPLAGLTGEMGALARAGQVARPTAAVIPQVAQNAIGTAAENVATGARAIPERVGQVFGREPAAAAPTPGTMGSVGAGGTDLAMQRQVTAQSLPVPIDMTTGQLTRNPDQLRFEVETSKSSQGGRLREFAAEQNARIPRNFDALIDQTGAQTVDSIGTGRVVNDALVKDAAKSKNEYRVKYREAEKAGELAEPVATDAVVKAINDSASAESTAPVLSAARKEIQRLGGASVDDGGNLVGGTLSLGDMEQLRKFVNKTTGIDPTNQKFAIDLKSAIDQSTEGLGGQLYKDARKARQRHAQLYQDNAVVSDLLATRKGTADRKVALEDVFNRSILNGSREDLSMLRRTLHVSKSEEGRQAWRELQGATIRHIADEATKGVGTDIRGNPIVSPAKLNNAVRALDDGGRLDFVVGKPKAQQIRDLNEISKAVFTTPPGAVNTSNTASVLLAALAESGLNGSLTGLPIPVLTGLKVMTQHVKDRRIQQRVNQAIGIAKREDAARPKPIEGVINKKTIH